MGTRDTPLNKRYRFRHSEHVLSIQTLFYEVLNCFNQLRRMTLPYIYKAHVSLIETFCKPRSMIATLPMLRLTLAADLVRPPKWAWKAPLQHIVEFWRRRLTIDFADPTGCEIPDPVFFVR
jgi:hypothetical protein